MLNFNLSDLFSSKARSNPLSAFYPCSIRHSTPHAFEQSVSPLDQAMRTRSCPALGMTGEYMTFGQVCWELKSKVNGLNWLMSCLENKKAGKTFRDKQFIAWNSMAKTYDMIYIRRQFGTNTKSAQVLEYSTIPNKRPASVLDNAIETPIKAARVGAAEGSASASLVNKGPEGGQAGKGGKAGRGGKAGKSKTEPKELSPEERKKKMARKDCSRPFHVAIDVKQPPPAIVVDPFIPNI